MGKSTIDVKWRVHPQEDISIPVFTEWNEEWGHAPESNDYVCY